MLAYLNVTGVAPTEFVSFKPEMVTEGVMPIWAPVYVSGVIAFTVTVRVSAFANVEVPAVEVAVS